MTINVEAAHNAKLKHNRQQEVTINDNINKTLLLKLIIVIFLKRE